MTIPFSFCFSRNRTTAWARKLARLPIQKAVWTGTALLRRARRTLTVFKFKLVGNRVVSGPPIAWIMI